VRHRIIDPVCPGKLPDKNGFLFMVSSKCPRGELKVSTQNSTFAEVFLDVIRQAIREEIQAAGNGHKESGLLTPDELADKLRIPVSWAYEQSRQGKIPTHRLGRYIRFDLQEVLESQRLSVK
jgi:excisionase family DNA binding protein